MLAFPGRDWARLQFAKATRSQLRVAFFSKAKIRLISAKPRRYPPEPHTLGEHLLKRRCELGLLQREAAKLLGVSHGGYINWEKRGRPPEIRLWPAVINFLGFDPSSPANTTSDQLQAERRRLGWTYRRTADFLGINESTAIAWMTGEIGPFTDCNKLRAALSRLRGET